MNNLRLRLLTVLLIGTIATTALACQVPVFRYALERWSPDKYEVIVIHEGQLDTAAQSLLERLQAPKQNRHVNYVVHVAEVSSLRDQRLLSLWQSHDAAQGPLMVVLYPPTAMEVPDRVVDAIPLAEAAVQRLVQSPVRQQLAERLSSGQSAVWIFVPSGNADKDADALSMLNQRIAVNQKRLTLPTAEELEIEPRLLAENKIPLRIEFSILTLDPNDAREAFLLHALRKSEADLPVTEPMAFPVFGRGRVLYALVGRGIMPETTDMACKFMVGPCSCQVKNQNPGFDLLMSYDWEQRVAGSMISAALPDETAEPKLLTIPPGRRNK